LFEDIAGFQKKVVGSKSQRKILDHVLFGEPLLPQKNQTLNETSTDTAPYIGDDPPLKDYNLELARNLYEEGLVNQNTFSGLRLGDLYFYGKLSDDN
jgi:hypothetical protein